MEIGLFTGDGSRNGVVKIPQLESRHLFNVPKALIKILDRDLETAGIAKKDIRGRTLDVHALRTIFGTMLARRECLLEPHKRQ